MPERLDRCANRQSPKLPKRIVAVVQDVFEWCVYHFFRFQTVLSLYHFYLFGGWDNPVEKVLEILGLHRAILDLPCPALQVDPSLLRLVSMEGIAQGLGSQNGLIPSVKKSHQPWQIGLGRSVSTKKWWFSVSVSKLKNTTSVCLIKCLFLGLR